MSEGTNCRLLLVDDDEEFCLLVRDYMAFNNVTLTYALTGEAGLAALEEDAPDLVLLDMMLPDMPGVEVLRRLRARSGVPVIIFSAFNDETDRIVTLEIGADDYVSKSLSSRELLARVRAVLRRSSRPPVDRGGEIIAAHGIELNPSKFQFTFGGRTFELTYVEVQLLRALMGDPGRVLSRETLLRLFDEDLSWNKFDRRVDVHISSLRRKLAEATGSSSLIRTVRGRGYAFLGRDEDA